jgi:hypothetical protein
LLKKQAPKKINIYIKEKKIKQKKEGGQQPNPQKLTKPITRPSQPITIKISKQSSRQRRPPSVRGGRRQGKTKIGQSVSTFVTFSEYMRDKKIHARKKKDAIVPSIL